MRPLIFLIVVAITGCAREDGDRLARIGRLAADKVRNITPEPPKLKHLDAVDTPVDRVKVRLLTDTNLQDVSIEVVEAEDGIHLRGQVTRQEQAVWAERLAVETVGVPSVVNEITVAR